MLMLDDGTIADLKGHLKGFINRQPELEDAEWGVRRLILYQSLQNPGYVKFWPQALRHAKQALRRTDFAACHKKGMWFLPLMDMMPLTA